MHERRSSEEAWRRSQVPPQYVIGTGRTRQEEIQLENTYLRDPAGTFIKVLAKKEMSHSKPGLCGAAQRARWSRPPTVSCFVIRHRLRRQKRKVQYEDFGVSETNGEWDKIERRAGSTHLHHIQTRHYVPCQVVYKHSTLKDRGTGIRK